MPLTANANPIRVAISYAHGPDDRTVLDLADRLNNEGVDCEIDIYQEAPPQGWARWMTSMMTNRTVLVICSEAYYRRYNNEETEGVGLGATFESGLLVQRSYESQGQNKSLIPVLLEESDRQWIPEFLRDVTYYVIPRDYLKLYARLTGQAIYPKPPLGQIVNVVPGTSDYAKKADNDDLIMSPRETDPYPMLASQRSVPEGFVYVRLTAAPADEMPIITAALQSEIAAFVNRLPGLTDVEAETRQGGVLFAARAQPESFPHFLDPSEQRDIERRAQYKCWVRSDGDIEVRLLEERGNRVQQVLRALANCYAILQRFQPRFNAGISFSGKLAYKLGGAQQSGFEIAADWETWLRGSVSAPFEEAFLRTLLQAQTAANVAGEPAEMRKLLQTYWRSEVESWVNGDNSLEPASDKEGTPSSTITLTIGASRRPMANAVVAAVAKNGTVLRALTNEAGQATLQLVAGWEYTLLVGSPGLRGVVRSPMASVEEINASPAATPEGGSIVGLNGTADIPGLSGRLNPILDSLGRFYIYAENISINNESIQPLQFELEKPLDMVDALGNRFSVVIRFIHGRTFLIDYSKLS